MEKSESLIVADSFVDPSGSHNFPSFSTASLGTANSPEEIFWRSCASCTRMECLTMWSLRLDRYWQKMQPKRFSFKQYFLMCRFTAVASAYTRRQYGHWDPLLVFVGTGFELLFWFLFASLFGLAVLDLRLIVMFFESRILRSIWNVSPSPAKKELRSWLVRKSTFASDFSHKIIN